MTKLFSVFTSSIQRRILSSFAVVIVLVIIMTVAGYYQLGTIRNSSQEMIPESSQMGFLQDFGLAASSLDANLERYFVIGGQQFREAIAQDLEDMTVALNSFHEIAYTEAEGGPGEFTTLNELEEALTTLKADVSTLMETASSEMNSREVNQLILSVYSEIDNLKQLHQTLTAVTLEELQTSALEQERIASGVIAQFAILVASVFLVAVLSSLFVTRSIATPLAELAETASQIAAGDLEQTAKAERTDEIGALAGAFNVMTVQLREMVGSLEQQVADRTADLERRSRYLEATTDVARNAASVLELEELLARTAVLVSEQFGFYHTGIFLLDARREGVVLQAASSEGGQRMLERGHRLAMGTGIVGSVARGGEPRIALDVGKDAAFFDNPDLPDTRSELALPLLARGEIIGVLDVQSTEPEAFSDEDVVVLQTLADQVAMAISNARLFQQARESLEAERRAFGELSRQAWAELIRQREELVYRGRQGVVSVLEEDVSVSDELPTISVPVRVRGQAVAMIQARKPEATAEWTSDESEIIDALAEQLGLALESARLYQDTQRRAAQERVIGDVTARMRETLDIDAVLRTAVREIGESLALHDITVRLEAEDDGVG